ncbi:MAG: hypothetical protein ACK5ME_06490 [Parahaliea sp.]
MKILSILILTVFLVACGNSGDHSVALDLSQLPLTVVADIELDSQVEEGIEAFGSFYQGEEEVLITVSESVASQAGIDINNDYTGKVELTLSAEHGVSSPFARFYIVSKLRKL